MRIMMLGTEEQKAKAVYVEDPSDELTIEDVAHLLKGLLLAWGFHPESVASIFDEELK